MFFSLIYYSNRHDFPKFNAQPIFFKVKPYCRKWENRCGLETPTRDSVAFQPMLCRYETDMDLASFATQTDAKKKADIVSAKNANHSCRTSYIFEPSL